MEWDPNSWGNWPIAWPKRKEPSEVLTLVTLRWMNGLLALRTEAEELEKLVRPEKHMHTERLKEKPKETTVQKILPSAYSSPP